MASLSQFLQISRAYTALYIPEEKRKWLEEKEKGEWKKWKIDGLPNRISYNETTTVRTEGGGNKIVCREEEEGADRGN